MNSQLYINGERELDDLLNNIKSFETVYIYSAGNRAKEIVQMIKIGFLNVPMPSAFFVTEMKGGRECIDNPSRIDDIPVYVFDEFCTTENMDKVVVWVVAMEHYHNDIQNCICKSNFKNIFFLTDVMERILIANCMKYYFKKIGLPYIMTDMVDTDTEFKLDYEKKTSIMTYMVQSENDELLSDKRMQRKWITPLQAGALSSAKKFLTVTDADGENISEKNSYYNEMTGMYWVWKNTNWDISGICHYRRQFESDVALISMLHGKFDVVLPVPALVYPNLREYYRNWGEDIYYQIMLQVIRERHQEYYETAVWCAEHSVFFPNNIFLAKKTILDDYCQFAFDVIDEIEKRIEKFNCSKQTRCWQSEHVTTIYFFKNLKHYKVIFSNLKRFW